MDYARRQGLVQGQAEWAGPGVCGGKPFAQNGLIGLVGWCVSSGADGFTRRRSGDGGRNQRCLDGDLREGKAARRARQATEQVVVSWKLNSSKVLTSMYVAVQKCQCELFHEETFINDDVELFGRKRVRGKRVWGDCTYRCLVATAFIGARLA